MSYLNAIRLHFAGKFQANVSTVNNDPTHFDSSKFLPQYQTMQTALSPNGWFNPAGDAGWRLRGCRVTGAHMNGEAVQPGTDPVLDLLVADSDSRVCGKLVDLDPEQQLVSEIWGMQVRLCNGQGETLMVGDFEPAAFMDIWDRSTGSGSGGDQVAGAMYQSVLRHVKWLDTANSPFLAALKASSAEGLLSIKFNVDGINLNSSSAEFMWGRIVGTLGPASVTEPVHFVTGRQLEAGTPAAVALRGNFFKPAGAINFCVANVDSENLKVYLDLGNALSTTTPGGRTSNLGALVLHSGGTGLMDKSAVLLGTLQQPVNPNTGAPVYTQKGWYEATAGIVEFPITTGELAAITSAPLSLSLLGDNNTFVPGVAEAADGKYVRADKFVYRMNPEKGQRYNTVTAKLWATQFGAPLPGVTVDVTPYTAMLQGPVTGQPAQGLPYVATPEHAVHYTTPTPATGTDGTVDLVLSASDPLNPRGYIDGQVYGLRVSLTGRTVPLPNPWVFISLLVWDTFTPGSPITWHKDIQPIFKQYANLYPVMKRFMDLANYEQVVENAELLVLAFELGWENPNSMPVTRDLSDAKRTAILDWLRGSNTQPKLLRGDPGPHVGVTDETATALVAGAVPGSAAPNAPAAGLQISPAALARGGKAAAAARRSGAPAFDQHAD